MRPRPASLQARLTAWLIASAIVLFGLYWVMTSTAPRRFIEDYVLERLEHDIENVLIGLNFDQTGTPSLDPAYIPPIYKRPYSGHYYVLETPAKRLRSRSLWDEDLAPPPDQAVGLSFVLQEGPRGQQLLVWAKDVEKHGHGARIIVAEDLSKLEGKLEAFRMRLALLTVFVLAGLILAQRLIIRLSLRPLERLGEDCRRLQEGRIGALGERVPSEVLPLVQELNHLLALMGKRIQRSRTALGNLAHALKTPLTRLSQAAEEAGPALQAHTAEELIGATQQIRDTIDHELKRARLAGDGAPGRHFDVSQELPQLIGVLGKIYSEKGLRFEQDIAAGESFPGDREDMLELFGNLLDNAAKWARSRVRLQLQAGTGLAFSIEDDGPGVAAEDLAQLAGRGIRLDEATPGHGLGLSIVREIVNQYHGTLRFEASALGGLRVSVSLAPPRRTPSQKQPKSADNSSDKS